MVRVVIDVSGARDPYREVARDAAKGRTMAVQITHIRFSGYERTHEAIASFAWRNDLTGNTGESTKAGMVDFLDNQNGSAFVSNGSVMRVAVITVHPDGGTPYVRTYADNVLTNNLLSLPTF
jgi:hypothetical protein